MLEAVKTSHNQNSTRGTSSAPVEVTLEPSSKLNQTTGGGGEFGRVLALNVENLDHALQQHAPYLETLTAAFVQAIKQNSRRSNSAATPLITITPPQMLAFINTTRAALGVVIENAKRLTNGDWSFAAATGANCEDQPGISTFGKSLGTAFEYKTLEAHGLQALHEKAIKAGVKGAKERKYDPNKYLGTILGEDWLQCIEGIESWITDKEGSPLSKGADKGNLIDKNFLAAGAKMAGFVETGLAALDIASTFRGKGGGCTLTPRVAGFPGGKPFESDSANFFWCFVQPDMLRSSLMTLPKGVYFYDKTRPKKKSEELRIELLLKIQKFLEKQKPIIAKSLIALSHGIREDNIQAGVLNSALVFVGPDLRNYLLHNNDLVPVLTAPILPAK